MTDESHRSMYVPSSHSLPASCLILYSTSIQILDDYSLLNIFYLYRPVYEGGEEIDEVRISNWRWWYKPAQICGRWRRIILGSASYLGLCLVCANGTLVTDMLAHSPPFPLIINFIHELHDRDVTAEDEEGIVLALQQYNRVRHIHLRVPIRNSQRFIMAIDEEYSVLESLIMLHPKGDNSMNVTLPQTFRAPRLQRLVLSGFAFSTGSPLRTTIISRLVTLRLYLTHPSAYFRPNIMLRYLSAMPQLETLVIGFFFPVPNREVERQLVLTPIGSVVTLPSLRYLTFQGASAYLEALVCGITTPRLEKLGIAFLHQLIFSLPHLLQFLRTTTSLEFREAEIEFSSMAVRVGLYPRNGGGKWAFRVDVDCEDLDWQVSSVAEISEALSEMFLAVEHLTLGVRKTPDMEEGCYEVDWHRLLSRFGKVKTLFVDAPLVAELSRCFLSGDKEPPFGLLPKLQQLLYSGVAGGDAFRPFIDSRRNASRPITLIPDYSPGIDLDMAWKVFMAQMELDHV